MKFLFVQVLIQTAILSLAADAINLNDAQWKLPKDARIKDGVITLDQQLGKVTFRFAEYPLPISELKGKICVLRGKFRTEGLVGSERKSNGGRINIRVLDAEGRKWFAFALPLGTVPWTPFQLHSVISPSTKDITVQCGPGKASGKTEFSNLELEISGMAVPLDSVANMAWSDQVANDGKGGWHDGGPEDDGRYLERAVKRKLFFNGYPFSVNTGEKSILVMNQPTHFPRGPKNVELRPGVPEKAKYLYLLHTSLWMERSMEDFAKITVTYDSNEKQEIFLRNRRDLADWSHCVSLKNAKMAVRAKSESHANVALYASRFSLKPEAGKVRSIRLETLPSCPVWIIAGITLSDSDFQRETPVYRVREDAVWKPLQRSEHNTRIAGSALDLSPYRDNSPCGTFGRVIVTPDGHFAFEKRPDKKIRFFANTVAIGYLRNHDAIDTYVDELCKNGFNMLRIHYLDLNLVRKMKEPDRFDANFLDCFEYLTARCKERGIYLNLDCMTNSYGYTPGEAFGKKEVSYKSRIYFEPEIRKQWSENVRKLLTKVNPYTGTKLVDDPVLAMTVGYNEQEFGFLRQAPESALPAWRAFLKKRYGTIDALRAAWGAKANGVKSFDSIPLYPAGIKAIEQDGDVATFAFETELECMQFYRRELDAIGYKGPLSGFNMIGNKHYLMLRRDFDYVSKNSYEMLMTLYSLPGSTLDQSSSISNFSKMLRNSLGARIRGKAFFVTEYGIPFWNRHRYEMSYTLGAYAAFQDFDGVAAFGDSYAYPSVKMIRPVRIYSDPVSIANEFLTFFMFMREDVSPAKGEVTIRCYEDRISGEKGERGGPRLEEGLYGLMTKVDWEVVRKGKEPQHNHLVLEAAKSSTSEVGQLHSSSKDDSFEEEKNPADLLRKKGVIGTENRSDGICAFEADNGEIYLNSARAFMRIDTPRFQGICGMGGSSSSLSDFKINRMSANGNMSLVALDGLKPIREAERLILVYATNALNSGMEFDSPEMRMLNELGGLPTLLECATFSITVRNKNAKFLKLYPLDLQGKRQGMIAPVSVKGDLAEFYVDTAKTGAAMFFTIALN